MAFGRIGANAAALCALLLALPTLASLRGASPDLQARLSTSGVVCVPLHAPAGARAVPIATARVNDDFCDCRDGADEPGTAACANGRFWCANGGYKGASIPSSRVDDGVCDCCDGSDERDGLCKDECALLRNRDAKVAAEQAARIMAGVKMRKTYAKRAAADARKDRAALERLRRELKDAQRLLDAARRQTEALQARQAMADVKEEAGDGDAHAEGADVEGEADEVPEDVVADGESAKILEDGLDEEQERSEPAEGAAEEPRAEHTAEGIAKVDAEPEKLSVEGEGIEKASAAISEGVDNTSAVSDAKDLSSFCAELSGGDKNVVVRKLWILFSAAAAKVQWVYPSLFKRIGLVPSADLDKCISRAEDQKNELEGKVRDIEDKIAELTRKTGFNYGSDGALRQLHGQCIRKKVTQYEFEHCPFDTVRQYEDGRLIASLGKFESVSGEDEQLQMIYKNGDHCWNGPERSIVVSLRCGEKDEVVSVDEPSRCTYEMVFTTPAGCTEAAAKRVLAEVTGEIKGSEKDEL